MARRSLTYLICYDIIDDRRRYRIARCLEGFGDRIQYSVFEAVLDADLLTTMIQELESLLCPEEDKLAIIPVCSSCRKKRRWWGGMGPPWQDAIDFYVI